MNDDDERIQVGLRLRKSIALKIKELADVKSREVVTIVSPSGIERRTHVFVTQSDLVEMAVDALEREIAQSVPSDQNT